MQRKKQVEKEEEELKEYEGQRKDERDKELDDIQKLKAYLKSLISFNNCEI